MMGAMATLSRWVLAATLLAIAPISIALDNPASGVVSATLLHEWTILNFTWPSTDVMNQYLKDGRWVPENCVLNGMKWYAGTLYVTVARWRSGVPSTFNKVVQEVGTNRPLLQPFPNWDWQDINNPASLQYVQSMEISPDGMLWILDAGRRNLIDGHVPVVNGAPKIVIYNLNTDNVVHTYVFTDDQASYTKSWLNDIILDTATGSAYISDPGTSAIVIYSWPRNTARRVAHSSMAPDLSTLFVINGVDYGGLLKTPVNGIALSPDAETLYYCALRSTSLYSLPTSILRNLTSTANEISALVRRVGDKPPSDGMTSTSDGRMYFGALTENAVVAWDMTQPLTSQSRLVQDDVTMQWVNGFGFGKPGQLLYVTNRVQLFVSRNMSFNSSQGANFRIFAIDVGQAALSYMAGQQPAPPIPGPPVPPPPPPAPPSSSDRAALVVAVVLLAVSVGLLFCIAVALGCLLRSKVRRDPDGINLRSFA